MTNHNDDATERMLAGCGFSILIVGALGAGGFAAAVIFVLFNIGAWIGGQ